MCTEETKEEIDEEIEAERRESTGRDIVDMLTDIRQVAELAPLIEEIERSLNRIEQNIKDERSTSIKIGTDTRFQAKIYIDPTKPKEAREIVETTIDQMELGQEEITRKKKEIEERLEE